ncbi:uncharacterized protein PAE49_023269 isoform 2-T2 [Odontesthes bonariensis]
MAARLLFVIFMCCLHEIQARGQKSELSVNPGEADVIFVCLLPGSVKHDTTCNLYFGEERSPVRTLTARENRNSKKYPWICQFFLPVDDILKRLLLVQQKDASCDYSLENKLNSFSPRSDPRSLADYVKGVSNSAVTMRTAKSTVSKFSFSTPTASVNLKPVSHRPQNTDTLTTVSTTDYVKGVSNSAVTMRTAKSTVSKFNFFTPTASVNLKPVSHRTQNTDTLTTVSTTAKSTVSKLSFSTSTASVNLKPVSHRPQNTDTLTTVSTTGLTVSHRLTSAHATSGHTTSGSDNHNPTIDMSSTTRTTGNVTSGNNKTEITDMWRIVAAVAGGGITAGIIVLVLTCLRVKKKNETPSHKRTRGNLTDDFICMNDIDKGGMSPSNNGVYSVITSPPGGDCPAGTEKLNRQKPQLEDSDVYHVYCTIPEKPAPSAKQDMVYSLLQTH